MTDPEENTTTPIKSEARILTCSICGNTILPDRNGWSGGHNAQPINDGRCCGDCNAHVVVPARLERILGRKIPPGDDRAV